MLSVNNSINVVRFIPSGSISLTYENEKLLAGWVKWANQATTVEQRKNILNKLIDCFEMNSATLNLSHLELSTLPDTFPGFLKEIDISHNNLNMLPHTLPESLEKLDVSYNGLKELPNILPNNLKTLDVSYNCLESLPDNLPIYLESLIVSHNFLKYLPSTLTHCQNLQVLYANHNILMNVPILPGSLINIDFIKNVFF
ncbi:MAG: hypothetical protein ACL7BU_15755 [Candidatus Phlomobacter fragariae]